MLYYNALAHHGILGQKWGVRRYQNEDGSLTDEGRKRYSQPMEKTSKDYARMKPKTMTSEELKAANARLQLERDYADKLKATSVKKRVLAKLGDTMLDTGAKLLSSTVTKVVTRKVDRFLNDYNARRANTQRSTRGSVNNTQRMNTSSKIVDSYAIDL